jgi:hypothetical protein
MTPGIVLFVRAPATSLFSETRNKDTYLLAPVICMFVRTVRVNRITLRNADNAFNQGANTFVWDNYELQTVETATSTGLGEFNWDDTQSGDTFPGIPAIQILINGEAPTFPIASARIHFRRIRGSAGTPDLELSTTNLGIEITDAPTWILHIPAFLVELVPGTYYYDLETTDSEDTVRTYVSGSWKITQDNTP